MLVVNDKTTQIDSLLDKMAEEVQLDETRYNRMITSYEAIKKWIEADEKFFKPYKYDVYPHGSVRIFTTVKPINRVEFDLDIAIHFKDKNLLHSPMKIYTELKRRLNEHERYKNILKSKSRCLTLDYSGDFHMDIMPGIQDSIFDEDKMKVPDRKLKLWVSSNPRGYAKWFIAKANLAKTSLLEKAFRAERIQVDDFRKKKPLQRAVQLIKRYRDIYFEDDDTYKTRSIILTTIAGQFYNGEESIFKTIDNIVTTIRNNVNQPVSRLKVLNPVNSEEDFTDKWDSEPEYYEAFKKFAYHLYEEWQKLKKENGVIEEGKIFKGLFGDKLFEKVHYRDSNFLNGLRDRNEIGIIRNTGIITASKAKEVEPIKRNTFFGDERN